MNTLTIESVAVLPLWFSMVGTPTKRFASDAGGGGGISCIAIYLRTGDGPTGVGYNFDVGTGARLGVAEAANKLADRLIGEDVLAPELLWATLFGSGLDRNGLYALSAIDTACWDALAKAAGLPLATVLGGFTHRVPVYGSGGRRGLSDADLVQECVDFATQGMTGYKFRIGAGPGSRSDRSRDEARIALLRREMGRDFSLFADANQSYGVDEAIEVSRMLREHGVAWFEEPVPADAIDDLAAVASRSVVPIAAGENNATRWTFREMCEKRAAAILQPDIGRCGGVSEFRKVAHLAEAFDLKLCTHVVPELSISVLASSPNGFMAEYTERAPEDLWTRSFPVVDGFLEVPDAPGHGVELSSEAISKYGVS